MLNHSNVRGAGCGACGCGPRVWYGARRHQAHKVGLGDTDDLAPRCARVILDKGYAVRWRQAAELAAMAGHPELFAAEHAAEAAQQAAQQASGAAGRGGRGPGGRGQAFAGRKRGRGGRVGRPPGRPKRVRPN
jgi:hypothetical protein